MFIKEILRRDLPPGAVSCAPIPGQGDRGLKIDDSFGDEEKVSQDPVVVKPPRTRVIPMTIPQLLKDCRQWVLWRYEQNEKDKWTKVPYHAKYTRRHARSNDSTTWSSFDAALEGYLNTSDIDGIGFVPSPEDDIVGIDLDHCIDDAGTIAPWAKAIVILMDSYTETTPSGHGLRIFIRGKKPSAKCKKGDIEVYEGHHYLSVTGNHVPSTPQGIEERQAQLDTFMEEHFSEKKDADDKAPEETSTAGTSNIDDDRLIDLALAAKNGDEFRKLWEGDASEYPSLSEADLGFMARVAFWSNRDAAQMDRIFRRSRLYRSKWDEKHGEKTYGKMTIEKAIAGCKNTYNPRDDNLDIELRAWPILDPKALHGIAGRVAELATRHSEADPTAVLITFLVRFAAEVGPSPHLLVGDAIHYARLSATIVGASAKSRKGTSWTPIRRIFTSYDPLHVPASTCPGPLSSGEGLVFAVRDEVKEWKLVDKKTNTMDWVVMDPGVTDKRLFVMDEEFGAALSCTKREGNTLSTIMRQAWDHGNIEPLTKHYRIKATKAHICIVTHITNAELQQKLHETEALNGFGNRILWVCARRQKLVPRPMPMSEDEVLHIRNQIMLAVRAAQGDDTTMQLSNEAWTLWDKVYPELSKDHHGLAGVIINRAEVQVIRLAMVYALLDEVTTIELHHLEAALALWKYCEDSALFIFGDRERDAVGDKILEFLATGPQTATDIYNHLGRHVRSDRISETLSDFMARGKVTSHQEKTEGRTRTVFSLPHKPSAKSALSTDLPILNTLNALSADEIEI